MPASNSTPLFLVVLSLHANSGIVPRIPSCYCMLLIQPSPFELIKLHLPATQSTELISQVYNLALTRNLNAAAVISSPYCDHSNVFVSTFTSNSWAAITQSVQRLATDSTVRRLTPGGSLAHTSSLAPGVFPGGQSGRDVALTTHSI